MSLCTAVWLQFLTQNTGPDIAGPDNGGPNCVAALLDKLHGVSQKRPIFVFFYNSLK